MHTPLSIFKIRAVAVVSTLTLALVSGALSAQMPAPRSQVNVPFDFQVGSTHLAAGTYILSNPRRVLLLVQGAKHSAFAMSLHETSAAPAKISKVVFHRYGEQYFLREVWMSGYTEHVDCVQSDAEQEAKRSQQGDRRAYVATSTDVEVALLESPR